MKKQFFSLEEARGLLPRVKPRVAKMVRLAERLQQFQPQVKRFSELGTANAGGPDGTAYVETLMALQLCVQQVQELGCLVKGVQEGLIDFPHWMEGREVYLCWKHGEDDIAYWHEVDAGFAGRTPILERDSKEKS